MTSVAIRRSIRWQIRRKDGLCKLLGFNPFRNPFGWTLMVFLAFVIVLAGLASSDRLVMSTGLETSLTAVFTALVYILVTVNTVIFLIQSMKQHRYVAFLPATSQMEVQWLYGIFIIALILSVSLSGFLGFRMLEIAGAGLVSSDMRPGTDPLLSTDPLLRSWLQWSERASLFIFALFSLADYLLIVACDILLQDEDGLDKATYKEAREEIADRRNETWKFLMACDVPGLMGICLIFLIGILLHGKLAGLYWDGFGTGAIALHMTFSQSVLAFLSVRVPKYSHTTDSPSTVRRLLGERSAVMLDVREDVEWNAGHLDVARHLPVSTLEAIVLASEIYEVAPKEQFVYLHCADGKRVLRAAELLERLGYEDVRPLKDGYDALLKAGFEKA